MSFANVKSKRRVFIARQTLATLAAVVAAVALPQLFHVLGAAAGLGTALGEIFLPMHLPILLVGLLAGPLAGGLSGFAAPLLSFLLTGMPKIGMLPFMMIELAVYGLACGLLRHVKLPTVVKVLVAQVAGRGVRAVAILIAYYAFAQTAIPVATIWQSVPVGAFGILLQLVLLPLIVYRVRGVAHDA